MRLVDEVGHRLDRVIARVRLRLGGNLALVAHGHSLRVTARWLRLNPAWGASFRLKTASVGVLGFGHERQVIRHWSER